MGHLQVVMLPEWYFIAPDAAVNQTFDLYVAPSTYYVVWNFISTGSGKINLQSVSVRRLRNQTYLVQKSLMDVLVPISTKYLYDFSKLTYLTWACSFKVVSDSCDGSYAFFWESSTSELLFCRACLVASTIESMFWMLSLSFWLVLVLVAVQGFW